MKLNIDFLQTGGLPLTNDLMNDVMQAIELYDVLGAVCGGLTIVSGCTLTGSYISPGVVAVNNEVLVFEGGTVQQTVFVNEENIYKTFEDQTAKILIKKKIVKFGNASVVYNWADFVRIPTLKDMKAAIESKVSQTDHNLLKDRVAILELKTAPIINGGVIWAFGKPVSEIPVGWKEAIDIRGKTIVGLDPNDATFSTLGANVGSKTHTLTKAQLPTFDGDFQTITGNGYGGSGGFLSVVSQFAAFILGSNNGQFSHKTLKIKFGENQPHNIIQPSRIANFIEPNFQ